MSEYLAYPPPHNGTTIDNNIRLGFVREWGSLAAAVRKGKKGAHAEAINLGNSQGNERVRGKLGYRREGRGDGPGAIVFIAASGVGIVCGGWGGGS